MENSSPKNFFCPLFHIFPTEKSTKKVELIHRILPEISLLFAADFYIIKELSAENDEKAGCAHIHTPYY